ncbi:preprotein translocase subunit SecE [Actinoplanes sp. SE50]|uniref:preprotein translocase subunit SecE n=1 Tax=unclassified Actinoplanes TaxID=2626549 RepID=UPI00023ED19B|nr:MULTISPECIES: preprotein translocase subunit SecE [unclassified Actinoplanes]AEV81663.1 putative preprotein translocase subunit secE [Actinoplanes sp. SE50/110]ATO80064.1 preprotein translocase subunit SecE [Actinoplanes sp. SE50]SLL97468.1 preprotein translocase subunit SecE [Actinoplanes sp. SE50/110]
MADKNRPGDDVPGDDELLADVVDGDDADEADAPVSRGGGTAVAERTKDDDSPKTKKERKRTGFFGRIGGFFREVISELRKVIWPTRKELLTYTTVVIAFVTIMTAIVGVLDYGFAQGMIHALGGK